MRSAEWYFGYFQGLVGNSQLDDRFRIAVKTLVEDVREECAKIAEPVDESLASVLRGSTEGRPRQ